MIHRYVIEVSENPVDRSAGLRQNDRNNENHC